MLQAVRLLTELTRPSTNDRQQSDDTIESRQIMSAENSVQFREIYKNGWLRRTDKTDKEISRFWVAFCVHDDLEPKLEGFADQKQATTHSPLWANSLRGIQHLSPTLCATSRHDYEFCINFHDDRGVLRLAAPTYQGMLDWVHIITRKLTDMKILGPKENVYSRGPERIATRDPTSPLPPPPLPPESWTTQPIVASNESPMSINSTPSPPNREEINQPTPSVFTFEDITISENRNRTISSSQSSRAVRSSSSSSSSSTPSTHMTTSMPTTSSSNNDDTSYESIFMASSYSPNSDALINAIRETGGQLEPSNDQYAALIEYRSSGTLPGAALPSVPSISSTGPVRPIHTTTSAPLTVPRQLTLREKQVSQLTREMSHSAGVRLQLGRRDCKDSIAFVDAFGSIWVAGWKHREHPLLYNVLHVGDMVMSVAGITPPSASAVRDILKGITTPRVEVIVRRLPHAKAMTLTKATETDDFGLVVHGNEVSGVSGAATAAGLTPLTDATDPTAPAGSHTTWTLTEANGRPLNMFDDCANERLSAVGRDISIVVQPTDFVASLRKKLRSIRGYKNFIFQ